MRQMTRLAGKWGIELFSAKSRQLLTINSRLGNNDVNAFQFQKDGMEKNQSRVVRN